MRARVALLVACYASMLLSGALLHHAGRCANPSRPHCALCASVETVLVTVEPDTVSPTIHRVGAVVLEALPVFSLARPAHDVTRAPPSRS